MNKTAQCMAAILAVLVIATPVYLRQRVLLIEGQGGLINPPPMARIAQESGEVSLGSDGQGSSPENSEVPAAARGVGDGGGGKLRRGSSGAKATVSEPGAARGGDRDKEPGAARGGGRDKKPGVAREGGRNQEQESADGEGLDRERVAAGGEETTIPERRRMNTSTADSTTIAVIVERETQPAPLTTHDGIHPTSPKPAIVNTSAEPVEILKDGTMVPMEYPLVPAIPVGLSDHRLLDDGAFMTVAGPYRTLYMFSAFWDQRPPLLQPLIRIVSAIGHNTTMDETMRAIFCYVYCMGDNGEQGHIEISRPVTISLNVARKMDITPERQYWSVTVTCRPRACAGRLRRVSLGHSADKQTAVGQWRAGLTVPVEVMAPRGKEVKLGTCVPIVFNQLNPKLLVEWFELQRILGVGKVFMTNDGIDSESWHVLRHYIDQGYLTVQRSNFIELKDTYADRHTRSTLAVTHCMYAMAYTFDKLMIIDVDEIIVPRRERTLVELLDTFAREERARGSQPVINYRFLHSEFILQHEYGAVPDENYPAFSTYMRYRRRAEYPSKTNSHVKSILDPMHCVAARNHYCTARLEGDSMVATLYVPRDVALDCHYRRTSKQGHKIKELFPEDIMIKYADELLEQVKKTLDKLHIKY